MTGVRTITHDDCANLVDDFLAAHRKTDSGASKGTKPATKRRAAPRA
jgi:hypothetical protein